MGKKITWEMIYKEFKQTYPRLRKEVYHWHPYDYLTIKLYFSDGHTGLYNFFEHRLTFTEERWL